MTARNALLYLRVSTDAQDTENQLTECQAWATRHDLWVSRIVRDTASTREHWRLRSIAELLQMATSGDTIICSEVSRLARSTLEVLEILAVAAKQGVGIHIVKSALVLDGTMQARIVVTVLALAAEIEREFIRSRTRAALAARRAKGLPLGRPKGSSGRTKIDARGAELRQLQNAGVSAAAMARLLRVSRGTVRRWIIAHAETGA